MDIIPQLVGQFSWAFYFVCAIAGAYFVVTLATALRDLRRSAFFLERASARDRAVSSAVRIVICGIAALGVWMVAGLANQGPGDAGSALPRPALTSPGTPPAGTPSPGLRASPPATSTAASGVFSPSVIFAGIGTAAPPPVTGTARLSVTVSAPVGGVLPAGNCASPMAQIATAVAPGKVLTVTGSAIVETGGAYRVELLAPGTQQWVQLARSDTSASNTPLVRGFSLQTFPPGTYGIRVTSLRADGAPAAVCQRSVALGS